MHRDRVAGAADDDYVLHGRRLHDGLVDVRFERDDFAATIAAVRQCVGSC
jgi:hypothetical protein